MTSLVGCSGESFASILRALGYVSEQRKGPAITVPLIAKASTEPVHPIVATERSPEASEAPADAVEAAPVQPAEAMPDSGTGTAAEMDRATEPEESGAVAAEAAQAGPVAETVAASSMEAETEAPAEAAPEAVVQESTVQEGVEQESTVQESVEQESIQEKTIEAEVPMIEIWRPHRQTHVRRDRRPAHKQGQNTANGGAGFGQEGGALAASGKRDRNDRSRQGRGDRKPPEISAAGAEGAAAATLGEASKTRYEKRPDQKRHGNHDDKRKDETRKEPWREASRDGTRQNRRNDERRERRPGSFTSTEKPRERDRQPDPNSPFAKLLILKQQMESQGNKN
jgi:ATP-dependent RNA helicase SUPV3L1/SUV3